MAEITAFNAVLGTLELSEEIFGQLTFKQLFQAQRVCRTFKAAILRSNFLGEKMFLEPKGVVLQEGRNPDTLAKAASDLVFNPLIAKYIDTQSFEGTQLDCHVLRSAMLKQFSCKGSWEQTFFTQPATHSVTIQYSVAIQNMAEDMFDVIESAEGVRLGEVVDRLKWEQPKKPKKSERQAWYEQGLRMLHRGLVRR